MEEQKKYFIISTIMFVIIAIVILQVDKYYDNKVNNNYTLETNKLNNQYINVNDFGIYLQDKENSNNYIKQSTNNYPTQGYILNTSRTECFDYHGVKQAGKVSQTDEGRIRLETTVSIYCQMYFDIDNEAPRITSMSISGTDKEGKTRTDYIYNTTINYTFSWTAPDVVYYCVKEGNTDCTESDWKKTNKLQSISGKMDVSNSDGAKTINAYIRDKARNVSNVMSKTITVDRTAPTVTLTLKGSADTGQTLINGDTYTQTKSITYTASITETNMDGYCIGEGDCTSYISSTNKTFNNVEINVSDTEGLKTIKINVKDKAGNVGSISQTITLDKANPVISNFTITGNKANTGYSLTSGYTQTTKVNYSVTWSSSDVVSFCINTSNNTSGCVWNNDSSSPGALNEQTIPTSTVQGEKTLYAFVRDVSGRVSSSKVGNIKYDSTDPNVSISGETSTTDTITYTITASDNYPNGSVTRTCWAVTGSKTTNGTISNNTCTIKNLSENASYTIYAKAVDLSGRYTQKSTTISTKSAKLGDYVKSKSPAGLNTTKELGGLYRFVGACNARIDAGTLDDTWHHYKACEGIVDNFICFGTENPSQDCAGKIDSDYMYRIIGIDPNTGDLKLIKNVELKSGKTSVITFWHSNGSYDRSWAQSDLFKRLNGLSSGYQPLFIGNSNYIIRESDWYEMIRDTDWIYGDIWMSTTQETPTYSANKMYAMESGGASAPSGASSSLKWTEHIDAKIGLTYIHDYYFSYAADGINSEGTVCSTSTDDCQYGWLNVGNCSDGTASEWTMTRLGMWGDGYLYAYRASSGSNPRSWHAHLSAAGVRPVFYLDSAQTKLTGSGTYDNPFVAMPSKTT